MSAPCFGRPIWLVQLSLLEAPAVVRLRTPRSRISHSPSFFSYFIFLPVGFVQIDVCRGRLVLLRYALPVGCYILCLFHPVSALRHKIFVFDLSSQRNKEV
ncbi:hypothetical protein (mitochondrion) [Glycine soja]|uniref:Uncharacterized protein n=2 Tax=Glycine subgen. Soja TaxID=1462606 RepID=M1FN41_SOYBN|nr:hypothetical protein I638_mgp079 [Glycine max]YP_009532806.1 hypothetical protein [Glycine soja]AFR34338.1 hypothetical protein GlmaxMp12 [Glycine max]AYD72954.1 hypothetical protein [Glycine soja]|eukprot:YP_007516861.1 hypothetical protein GlmaxMp12 (mitochondrion) [Glycine max]